MRSTRIRTRTTIITNPGRVLRLSLTPRCFDLHHKKKTGALSRDRNSIFKRILHNSRNLASIVVRDRWIRLSFNRPKSLSQPGKIHCQYDCLCNCGNDTTIRIGPCRNGKILAWKGKIFVVCACEEGGEERHQLWINDSIEQRPKPRSDKHTFRMNRKWTRVENKCISYNLQRNSQLQDGIFNVHGCGHLPTAFPRQW